MEGEEGAALTWARAAPARGARAGPGRRLHGRSRRRRPREQTLQQRGRDPAPVRRGGGRGAEGRAEGRGLAGHLTSPRPPPPPPPGSPPGTAAGEPGRRGRGALVLPGSVRSATGRKGRGGAASCRSLQTHGHSHPARRAASAAAPAPQRLLAPRVARREGGGRGPVLCPTQPGTAPASPQPPPRGRRAPMHAPRLQPSRVGTADAPSRGRRGSAERLLQGLRTVCPRRPRRLPHLCGSSRDGAART